MADKSVGTAFVTLKAKVDKNSNDQAVNAFQNLAQKLPAGIGDALGKATTLGSVFKNYSTALGGAKSAVSGLAGAIGAGAGAVGAEVSLMATAVAKTDKTLQENASSWEQLETKLLTINGLVGGSGETFDRFKEAIMGVASSTSWTAEQVADGMEALVRGGATAEQAIASIGTVADLARGQVADMGAMADLLGNTRNQFKLSIDDVTHIADVIASSTASSAQNVSDFAEALKMAGTTAGAMGQSLERTSAQIQALANVGIKGTMGGTAINALISRISGNNKARKELQGLGVKTHDENGILRPLDEILTDARKAMQEKGLSNAEQETAWSKIAGAENLKSALALSQNYLSDIAETLKSLDGTAKAQAQAIDSGLKGSKEILESARDAITKQLGEAGSEGLKERIDKVTEAVGIASEVAKDTAVNLDRYANATTAFGDIQGDLEILKQEITGSIVSAGASIAEGFKPILEALHEILKIIIDRDKYANKQIVNSNNKATQERKEQNREVYRETAKRLTLDSEKGKAGISFTTNDGVKLQGREAFEYAENRQKALFAKSQQTTLSDDENKELERVSSFVNKVEDVLAEVATRVEGPQTFLKNASTEELKKRLNNEKAYKEKETAIQQQFKEGVESGEFKENDIYGKAVLKNYSQVIKNISTANNNIAQLEAELFERERKAKEEAKIPKSESETLAQPKPEVIPPAEEDTKNEKKKKEKKPTPKEVLEIQQAPAPEPSEPSDNGEEIKPPTPEPSAPRPWVEPPEPEPSEPTQNGEEIKPPTLEIPKSLIPEEIAQALKFEAPKPLPVVENKNTFGHTFNIADNIPQEITDPQALNVLQQINAELRELNKKPVLKSANM